MIKLFFETLTPIHISNGNQLAFNLEYIIKDEYLAKLNPIKAGFAMAESKIFNYNHNYKFYEIIKIIEDNKNIFKDDDFDYQIYVEDTFLDYINNENLDGKKIVQEFINSNGNFYIPGSSIKGALTTILNRDPNKNPLGINPLEPKIDDKFVITDSDFLDPDDFVVDIAYRPPSVNLITLDTGVCFTSTIRKLGNLSVKVLKEKLNLYSFTQLKKAEKYVNHFKKLERKPGGATQYFSFIEKFFSDIKLEDDEYLINLGFGGGSYFKIYDNVEVPKFKSKKNRNTKEEAHTTFSVQIQNEFYQLGWCKLKIEEE